MSDLPVAPAEQRGAVAWMAGHSVAANLLMLILLVGGLFALKFVGQEVFPDLQLDMVSISVSYPGASPEEVESGVILAIEEAVRGLDGVDEVTSVANEGSGTVTVEVLDGADVQRVAQDIQGEVDRITTFHEDVEDPRVQIVASKRPVLSLMLYGEVPDTVLHQLGEEVRDRLLHDPDISQVEFDGLPRLEMGIDVPQEVLRRYGLTLGQVAQRLRDASVDRPSGALKTDQGEVLLRMKERRDLGSEFAQLPVVSTADGGTVTLGAIATIDDGFADTDRYSRYNDKPSLEIEVYRIGDQTPIQVSNAVMRQLLEIRLDLPPGLAIDVRNDRSEFFRQRVDLLLRNGLLGLILVFIALSLFLELRLAFWVMLGIPIAFLGSFLFLPAADVTINMMSLFAYIIALGIVVDDAIVVGENIYHHHQTGQSFRRAAITGVREVAMPVTFSVLTNIVTFMPLYFIPGTTGKFFKMIPIVVGIVFLISLVESVFILPAHLGHERDRRRHGLSAWIHARQQAFSHQFLGWVRRRYGPFLAFTMRHRYGTVAVAVAILTLVLAYTFSGRIRRDLFPTVESDYADVQVLLPYGAPVAKTEAVMQRLYAGAQRVIADASCAPMVEGIIADVGNGGSHTGRMRVLLADADVREHYLSTDEFTNRWREAVGEVAGVEFVKFASDSGGPGSGGRGLTIELSHRDSTVLAAASAELARIINIYPAVSDVDDGYRPGKPQLDFALTPAGKSLGLTAAEVGHQVRDALYGAEVARQQRNRNEIRIMVRLAQAERSSEATLDELLIRTPTDTWVPLHEIATAKRGRAYTAIDRLDGRRIVQVSANVTPRSEAGTIIEDLTESTMSAFVDRYPGLSYRFAGRRAEMNESFSSLQNSFIIALLVLYAMLAIPFRSWIQPFIVMSSIPFGVVGAIIGHLIMGYDLFISSLFGIVALSGVVVNDSLVMIDFANHRHREGGMTPAAAIHDAATQRFRAIMLTTLTTFGGLAPMIFETSRQATFLIPMALSLGFGLLFATVITLVLVPSLYLMVEDLRRFFGLTEEGIPAEVPGEDAVVARCEDGSEDDAYRYEDE